MTPSSTPVREPAQTAVGTFAASAACKSAVSCCAIASSMLHASETSRSCAASSATRAELATCAASSSSCSRSLACAM